MTRCPKCQADISEGKKFCPQCGTPLPEPGGEATRAAVIPPPPPGSKPAPAGPEPTIEATEMISPAVEPTEMIQPSEESPGEKAGAQDQKEVPSGTGKKYDISKIFETSGVCPNCYAPLDKGADSCKECGYALTGAIRQRKVVPPEVPPPVQPVIEPASQPLEPAGATVTAREETAHEQTAPTVTGAAAEIPVVPAPPKKKQTGLVLLLAGIVMVVVIGLAAVGYFAWPYIAEQFQKPSSTEKLTQDRPQEPAETGTQTDGPPETATDRRRDAQEYQAMGRWDDAATAWQAHLADHPEDTPGYLELARVQYQQGKLTESADTLQHYLNMVPADAVGLGLAGLVYTRLGRDELAEDRFLAAIAHDPANDVWHVELGLIYARGGFSDKAIEQYRKALVKQPDNERAHWLLIQELHQTSRGDEARRMAQSYQQQFPAGLHSEEVRQILAAPMGTIPARTEETEPAVAETRPVETRPRAEETPRRETSVTETVPRVPQTRTETVKPPPPSPYVTVILDGSSLNYSGKYAKVTITVAGIQQTFNSGTQARLQNVEKGAHSYSVTATFYNVANNEAEGTYTGSGMINIRYPDQRITVLRISDQIILK
ncbi:MAG: tetratricopeptide repeat protein [Acidobacteria bacterium]|nr:tetratricopeptide repeat protein [Acidobacteriota bacterium]